MNNNDKVCGCVTNGKQNKCLNTNTCVVCHTCMNWRGEEEGTRICSECVIRDNTVVHGEVYLPPINGVHYKVIPQLNENGVHDHSWWKCECGQVIKRNTTLYKHTTTKSHGQNLINRHYFAIPKQSLLRPEAK